MHLVGFIIRKKYCQGLLEVYASLLAVTEQCSGFRYAQNIFAFSIPSTSGSGTRPAPVQWVSQEISLQVLEADHSLP
jgi:hypothetical protein